MRTAEPSPPGEERGIEIGRGRGGGGGLTLASAHARTLTHTHTHRACVRHTVIRIHAAARLTPRHTPTHCHRDTHLQAETPEQHTHQRLFLVFTLHGPAGRGARKCPHLGHTQMHRHTDTSKHICPSDTQGLRQPKTSEGGVVEQNRDKTHSGTDTHQEHKFQGYTHQHTHTTPGTLIDTPHTFRADTYIAQQGHRGTPHTLRVSHPPLLKLLPLPCGGKVWQRGHWDPQRRPC